MFFFIKNNFKQDKEQFGSLILTYTLRQFLICYNTYLPVDYSYPFFTVTVKVDCNIDHNTNQLSGNNSSSSRFKKIVKIFHILTYIQVDLKVDK